MSLLAPRESLSGIIESFEGRYARVSVDRAVASGSPIRIDFADSMLLGETSACEASRDGHMLTIQVRDAIPMMPDLGRLIEAVLADMPIVAPGAMRPANESATA